MTGRRGGGWGGGGARVRRGGFPCGAGAPPSAPPPQDSLLGSGPSGRLVYPEVAGRPVEPVTARDNAAAIQAIEKRLRCTCGCGLDIYTCRTTDFNCSVSPALHRQVMALAEAGLSGDQIMASFVREHGDSMLMSPPKRGFTLLGYYGPWTIILVAATLLVAGLLWWTRRAAAGPAAAAPEAIAATPAELEQLRRELEHLNA